MAPAMITITDSTPTLIPSSNPNCNTNHFTITFNSTHTIHTTLTSDPTTITSWITAHSSSSYFGLDIEWRPNFGRQYDNPVATLQLCTTITTTTYSCLIIQLLYCPTLPPILSNFLSNPNLTFLGVGIHSDIEQLLVDYNLSVTNAVDLGTLAADKISGVRKGVGLKELTAVVLGVEVNKPKSVTLSRWDCEWLSLAQIQYAALDAFLSFRLGYTLLPLPSLNSIN